MLVLDLDDAHRVAFAVIREEPLGLALAVVLDDGVGGSQDPVGRPVVLLERDDPRAGEVPLELHDVADVRSAKRVDRLVRISHCAHVSVLPAEELEQSVLGVVRVLVLVDEDVTECLPPLRERVREAFERLDGEHDQVVEVDRVRSVEPSLVQLVRLGDRLIPERGDTPRVLLGRDELVLRLRDLVVDPTWREPLRILPELFEARLRETDLVLVVVDREGRPVAEPFGFTPEDPAAGGVEREDPDRTRRPSEHAREPLPHLAGGLVRERDGEDLVRLHAARADQMPDPIGEDRVFPDPAPATTRTGPSVVNTASRWASFRSAR